MIRRLTEQSFSAFVLAGGQSSRMGKNKALLKLGGVSLLQRALSLAESVSADVWIVGSRQKFEAFGRVIEDRVPGCGPLSGIDAALRQTANQFNLILAVDLPFLTVDFLRYAMVTAADSPSLVTVAGVHGKLQSLCAIYRREFLKIAEEALRQQRFRLDALLMETNTRIMDEAELARAGFGLNMFSNLNTPEEFSAAEKDLI
jgi:molybdopterin-guanine dinucleotide biosynthesis protein A